MAHLDGRIGLVVLLEDLDFGGTQRYALHLLANVDRSVFCPELWTLRGGRDFRPEVETAGIDVVDLTEARRVGPVAIARLVSRLSRHRPDVLYTLTVLPNIWGRLFAGLMGLPVVSGYRNDRPQQYEQLLSLFSTRIIANAERLKTVLTTELAVPSEKVAVVPNGVDTMRFMPAPEARAAEPLIVCVARRVPRKDLPTLVAAFRRVQARLPEARLEIIGDGSVTLEQGNGVSLLPGTTDVRGHLSRASLFALSSMDEGAPNAILEAMAMGLPVVATDVGGIAELVLDGVTGRLVPPGNPDVLADAMIDVLANETLRHAMGAAGRARAGETFSIAGMVASSEAILRAAAGR